MEVNTAKKLWQTFIEFIGNDLRKIY